jgi:hypothetical protein
MATIYQHPKLKKKEVAVAVKAKQPIIIEKLVDNKGNNLVLLSDYQKKEREITVLKRAVYAAMSLATVSLGVVVWLII